MTFPVIEGVEYTEFSSSANIPAGVQNGDLLVAVFQTRFEDSVTTPTGWTAVGTAESGNRLSVFEKESDGTETSVAIGTSSSLAWVFRISGADTGTAAEASFATGTSTAPDPPSVTASWGSDDNLWLAPIEAHDDAAVSAYPLTDNQDSTVFGTVGGAVCAAKNATATLNPGTYTLTGSTDWVAATVAVRPVPDANEDAPAEAASLAATAQDAGVSTSPGSSEATLTVNAADATVGRTGEPKPTEASVTAAALDATISAVGDETGVPAEGASSSVSAHDITATVQSAATRASVAVAAQDASVSASGSSNAGGPFAVVSALDATVTISAEGVNVNAEAAVVTVTANAVTPVGEANATAETATVSVAALSPDKHASAEVASVTVEAHGPQIALNPGEVASAGAARVTVSALDATAVVSGEDVTTGVRDADVEVAAFDAVVSTVVPPPPTYTFFPPTVEEHIYSDHPMTKRLVREQGLSVVLKGGAFETVRYVVPQNLDGQTEGEHYFVGGYHYTGVPEDVAFKLIEAGYEPELEEAAA